MKIICVGRNYIEHIKELGNQKPENPILFIKPDSAVIKKGMNFFIPEFSNDVHYEVEVVLKICKVGKHIQPEFAHNYFNEIALGIDFTARDIQNDLKSKGLPWELSKGFDGSALIGDFINKNEVNLNDLNFSLTKNNSIVQNGNTNQMITNIENLISYISKFFTLKKGDLIFTGTPSGVGKVSENDILEGFIENKSNFKISIY